MTACPPAHKSSKWLMWNNKSSLPGLIWMHFIPILLLLLYNPYPTYALMLISEFPVSVGSRWDHWICVSIVCCQPGKIIVFIKTDVFVVKTCIFFRGKLLWHLALCFLCQSEPGEWTALRSLFQVHCFCPCQINTKKRPDPHRFGCNLVITVEIGLISTVLVQYHLTTRLISHKPWSQWNAYCVYSFSVQRELKSTVFTHNEFSLLCWMASGLGYW